MSCCGKKRTQARKATQNRNASKPIKNKTASQHKMKHDTSIYFQYMGKRKLTVVGPNTRKHYRFNEPNAVVTVDPRDKSALTAVTALRQVRKVMNLS